MSDTDYRDKNERARVILARFIIGLSIVLALGFAADSKAKECEPTDVCA